MSKSLGVLFLCGPPGNVAVKRKNFGPPLGGESGEVSHPRRPSPEPFGVKRFMLDLLECLVDESVVSSDACFGVEVP